MILTFDEPQKLTDYFDVPVDTTNWSKQYESNQPATPKREIPEPNFSLKEALKPLSNLALPDSGLFLLALEIPHKAIFIGFSESKSKKSNIIHRLCRYRTVITATNVGNVHSPEKWQIFAKKRFDYFRYQKLDDSCSDVRFVIGQINDSTEFRYFVNVIRNNSNGILDEICSRLWNESNSKSVEILNNDVREHDFKHKVVIWSKEI